MASSKSTINVHLIGKQGSGKSSTGNSILQREAFRSVHCFDAVTVELKSEEVSCHGRLLRVWDGPGVTENDPQLVQIVKNIHDTVGARKPESHVLLWVFRYGEPCSVVDEHLLKELTKTFEQDFVKANSAVVVTHKDNFDFDVEGLHLTFETWMKEQAGLFGELCQMSDYKVLPINNRMKTEEQTQQLLSLLLGTEKGHVLEDVRHAVGEENEMCQDNQREEQQTERDTCPSEQQTEPDTCPSEQQTEPDTCPSEQQTDQGMSEHSSASDLEPTTMTLLQNYKNKNE
ncbi:hypothetical protein RRG08_040683 [Elysia crispata]|uniref:AIG1-type G domain-containing protein n=1 Tax=Elysia crispata TaxID=231223 RepID=A0AAE1E6L3_9GAST|nr:hypothetical protein RRG08_040683 [Elysia crispata]